MVSGCVDAFEFWSFVVVGTLALLPTLLREDFLLFDFDVELDFFTLLGDLCFDELDDIVRVQFNLLFISALPKQT